VGIPSSSVGPRRLVGLKNAVATCYMNAVLQQLYMIPPIRTGVLSVDEPAKSLVQEDEEAERKERERELNRKNKDPEESNDDPAPSPSDTDRKDTHRKVLMQLQSIFGHLLEGRLQFHIPKGFWRDFRFVTLHVS